MVHAGSMKAHKLCDLNKLGSPSCGKVHGVAVMDEGHCGMRVVESYTTAVLTWLLQY